MISNNKNNKTKTHNNNLTNKYIKYCLQISSISNIYIY